MNMRWIPARIASGMGVALLALAVAACGGASTTGQVAPKVTPTATMHIYPTYTPSPTIAPGAQLMTCKDLGANLPSQALQHTQVGDLLITQYTNNVFYASYQIPSGAAGKPLALNDPHTISSSAAAVNPKLLGTGGFYFTLCDTSVTEGVNVQAVTVRIASVTPYSGALAAWDPCNDRYFDASAHQVSGGGCGGGLAVDFVTQANFAANAGAGATATSQLMNATGGQVTLSPFQPTIIAPGHGFSVVTGITPPTTPGVYTFAIGVTFDPNGPQYVNVNAPVIIAPVTQKWTGQNCANTTMQAQIPSGSQSDYICPPAA